MGIFLGGGRVVFGDLEGFFVFVLGLGFLFGWLGFFVFLVFDLSRSIKDLVNIIFI